jgi:hypothetical protein
MKLGMYIMASEPILRASVCKCIYPIFARQRFGKNVTAATNRHTTIEELLDTSFSMRYMSFRKK